MIFLTILYFLIDLYYFNASLNKRELKNKVTRVIAVCMLSRVVLCN